MTSLDGLRALEQAASPGPWRAHDDHWIFDAADEVVFAGSMLIPDDAEFVVAARNALPGLLDRVAAAEAERDALAKQLDEALSANHDGGYAIIGLQAERDALRTALEAVRDGRWNVLDRRRALTVREFARAVLAASVPSGPAAGPTTSKETR